MKSKVPLILNKHQEHVTQLSSLRAVFLTSFVFLGFIFSRPNIFGEAYGVLGTFFWILTLFTCGKSLTFSNSDKVELVRIPFIFLFMNALYWFYVLIIDPTKADKYFAWSVGSSLLGTFIAVYCIVKICNLGHTKYLYIGFLMAVLVPSFGIFVDFVTQNAFNCTFHIFNGRAWTYEICISGGVYVSGRATGLGAEPGIFALQIALAMYILILNKWRFKPLLVLVQITFLALAGFRTDSAGGYILIVLAVFSGLIFKLSNRLFQFFILLIGIALAVSQRYLEGLFDEKRRTNSLSISDRGLNFTRSDYWEHWLNFPFGERSFSTLNSSQINLITESVRFGPIVIIWFLITLMLSWRIYRFASDLIPIYLIISLTVIFLQPAYLNLLWFILIVSTSEILTRVPSSANTSPKEENGCQFLKQT